MAHANDKQYDNTIRKRFSYLIVTERSILSLSISKAKTSSAYEQSKNVLKFQVCIKKLLLFTVSILFDN
ncbi:hypothetical protein CARUB_v10024786mg [Capsella rubella]|uniref:Uncharacterized protein n=1 Tax=Capsella rubella TaxID=81985 RepID=R0HFY4_9BRAS|nr:hypothetical protein CARUB_v10024786mg [Capsella rubella]